MLAQGDTRQTSFLCPHGWLTEMDDRNCHRQKESFLQTMPSIRRLATGYTNHVHVVSCSLPQGLPFAVWGRRNHSLQSAARDTVFKGMVGKTQISLRDGNKHLPGVLIMKWDIRTNRKLPWLVRLRGPEEKLWEKQAGRGCGMAPSLRKGRVWVCCLFVFLSCNCLQQSSPVLNKEFPRHSFSTVYKWIV